MLSLRLTPRSARPGLGPVTTHPDGAAALTARVAAAPVDYAANDELCRRLAKAWRIPRSAVSVIGGARAHRKTVHVRGTPGVLLPRLTAWADGLHA